MRILYVNVFEYLSLRLRAMIQENAEQIRRLEAGR